jgi:hypothetical protein
MAEKAQSVDGTAGHEDGAEWGEGESMKQMFRKPLNIWKPSSSHDGEDGSNESDLALAPGVAGNDTTVTLPTMLIACPASLTERVRSELFDDLFVKSNRREKITKIH